jgi:HrpA-like RNA helicase
VAGHLLKKQLLDPHWEKKAAEVTALERATLYGIVVYNGRRVHFSAASTRRARARSSSARRWSPANGTPGCRSWRPITS